LLVPLTSPPKSGEFSRRPHPALPGESSSSVGAGVLAAQAAEVLMRIVMRFLCSAAIVLFTGFVCAGDAKVIEGVDGRPGMDDVKEPTYFLWHNPPKKGEKNGKWHLTVTTAGLRHHFKGRVYIEGEGKFSEAEQFKGANEKEAEVWKDDWFHKSIKLSDNKHELAFDIVSEAKGHSGITFELTDGKGPLLWELKIGGPEDKDECKFDASHIKIGKDGKNPEGEPFQTYAHPDAKGHGK
jgi:hypothetical protein